MALLSFVQVYLPVTILSAAGGNSNTTTVNWWLGDYNTGYNAPNQQFVQQHRSLITRVYHCCSGPTMMPNGSMSSASPAFADRLRSMAAAEGMDKKGAPLLPLSPNTEALLAGKAVHSVPELVEIATKATAGGYVVDYEPHQDTTRQHAEARHEQPCHHVCQKCYTCH